MDPLPVNLVGCGENIHAHVRRELSNQLVIESGTQVASRGPTWRMATPLA